MTRGRHRTKFRNEKANPLRKIPLEDLPGNESVRIRHSDREIGPSPHMAPFRRWLRKQVGRPWDDVYSEIAHVSKDYVASAALKETIGWYVELKVIMIKDKPHSCDGYGRMMNPLGGWMDEMYVHPETRTLSLARARKRPPCPEKPKDFILISKSDPGDCTLNAHGRVWDGIRVGYRKIDGIWYQVKEWYLRVRVDGFRVITKRQLNHKELKSLGLSNSPKL